MRFVRVPFVKRGRFQRIRWTVQILQKLITGGEWAQDASALPNGAWQEKLLKVVHTYTAELAERLMKLF